jgi:hypothetical protein
VGLLREALKAGRLALGREATRHDVLELGREAWRALGIADLRVDHFVQLGDTYFVPDVGGGKRVVAAERGRFEMAGVHPNLDPHPQSAAPRQEAPRNKTPPPPPEAAAQTNEAKSFVRCATFDATKRPGDGYVFKRGRLGVGFYKDVSHGTYKHVPLGALGLNAPRHAPHQGWQRPKQLSRDTMQTLPRSQGDRTWRYTPNHR